MTTTMSARKRIPKLVKEAVLTRQRYACNECATPLKYSKCGVQLFDIDHIEMHAKTGDDRFSNLQALCLTCHRLKSAREVRRIAWETARERRRRKIVHVMDTIPEVPEQKNPFLAYRYIETNRRSF